MWMRWFPWRQLVSWIARSRGFVDPVKVLSRLESLGQPLEVKEPLELLRAGLVFHARGLLNTGAIQHNLDWVWPFWVERQYDPHDVSFLPRAFSVTHVNLTHRNWTAVGTPGCDSLPIVDPRGLVTPFWDGWSLDVWVLGEDGERLFPSRAGEAEQRLELDGEEVAVVTSTESEGLVLSGRASVERAAGGPELVLGATAASVGGGWLAVALRPYNPEGVSFVYEVVCSGGGWEVEGRDRVLLSPPPDDHRVSDYRHGDVHAVLPDGGDGREVSCRVGLATAAALYRLAPGGERAVEVRVPLGRESGEQRRGPAGPAEPWPQALAGAAELEVADPRIHFLYESALRSLVLCSPLDVYPGPYTYKRFWFRDAVFILHALLCAGLFERVERATARFPPRQTRAGHFLSQEGEWDSNGQVLWLLRRMARLTGRPLDRGVWRRPVERAAAWIARKRVADDGSPHAGLLPAGFSAEHLGPNDYYYWDDFWSLGGLTAAAELADGWEDGPAAARWRREGASLSAAVDRSLERLAARLGRPGIAASPYRRLDPGAIGSLAGGYPLQLLPADDPRLLDTAEFLHSSCLVHGAFFQDVIHSGINAYLTLHLAQVLLRAGDARWGDLLRRVADLASPTGQWPEAIHPRTGGGCMGDGHHVWAAAEWLLAIRNAFVREEAGGLMLAAGVLPEWVPPAGAGSARFGPAPTPWGPVMVDVSRGDAGPLVHWRGEWRGEAPPVTVRLPKWPDEAASAPGGRRGDREASPFAGSVAGGRRPA